MNVSHLSLRGAQRRSNLLNAGLRHDAMRYVNNNKCRRIQKVDRFAALAMTSGISTCHSLQLTYCHCEERQRRSNLADVAGRYDDMKYEYNNECRRIQR